MKAKGQPAQPTPKDLGLSSDSFVSITDTSLAPRVIANIEGAQKSGKDYFALSAPGPIVLFNFDCGIEGVIEGFVKRGKSVTVAGVPKTGLKYPSYHFARPIPEAKEGRRSEGYLKRVKALAHPIWERFIDDLDDFYGSKARTGIIDTGGAAFALARFAFHGMDKGKPAAADDPYGQKSGDMKAIFQGLITDGYNYDKNVLWLHRITEKWENNAPSGKFQAAGYKDVAYEVQLTVRTKKRVQSERGKKRDIFSAEVRDCRIDTTMDGEVFEDEQCRFATVMASIFGTDEEVWE